MHKKPESLRRNTFFKSPTITVTYDNNPYREGLGTGWGFSCVIRAMKKTILFDTGGDGSILLANMEKLGIDPKEIELIVLSHMHWDHIGGVYHFLNKNQDLTLYLPTSFSAHFKDDVRRYGATVVEVREAVRICDQGYSSGEPGGRIQEQSLFIQTDKGLIIITGCAHPGIVNIVQKAKELLKDDVLFVMGGFHLGSESKDTIEKIISDFKRLGVRYVGPCHCSGDTARQMFKKAYQRNFIHIGVGAIITMDDLKL